MSLIGERVAVTVAAGEVRIRHGVREVAVPYDLDLSGDEAYERAGILGSID